MKRDKPKTLNNLNSSKMQDRLIVLINLYGKSERTKNRDFGDITGIKKETIRALEDGRQRFNEEYISTITDVYPQFKMWFAFGETIPEAGQISPEAEEVADSYGETGTD